KNTLSHLGLLCWHPVLWSVRWRASDAHSLLYSSYFEYRSLLEKSLPAFVPDQFASSRYELLGCFWFRSFSETVSPASSDLLSILSRSSSDLLLLRTRSSSFHIAASSSTLLPPLGTAVAHL